LSAIGVANIGRAKNGDRVGRVAAVQVNSGDDCGRVVAGRTRKPHRVAVGERRRRQRSSRRTATVAEARRFGVADRRRTLDRNGEVRCPIVVVDGDDEGRLRVSGMVARGTTIPDGVAGREGLDCELWRVHGNTIPSDGQGVVAIQ